MGSVSFYNTGFLKLPSSSRNYLGKSTNYVDSDLLDALEDISDDYRLKCRYLNPAELSLML